MEQKREQKKTARSQEAIKNVTTNTFGVAQATNPLITVATYVAVFLTIVPIGLFGFVQYLQAQPKASKAAVLMAEEDYTALTVAERRAQRKAARDAREAQTTTAVAEPEVTVEVVTPGFTGNGMQNADFGTMPTPFAGGFGMMPMPPFGGFPGFGAMPTTDAEGFPAFGAMPTMDANSFSSFGAMPNADGNNFGNF